MRAAAELLGPLLLTLSASAGCLRLADAVPSLLLDQPRRVLRHQDVDSAERALGWRPLVPRSPAPRRLLTNGGSVAVELPGLLLCETTVGSRVPDRLLPPGEVTHETRFELDGRPALLADVVVDAEGIYQELRLAIGRRALVLRGRVPADALIDAARSLR